uniref:Uncharacterized protein n=1 Tax=Manihot esculenta TaxID=3983 RepID=A0A2C9WPL8_MANES
MSKMNRVVTCKPHMLCSLCAVLLLLRRSLYSASLFDLQSTHTHILCGH